MTWDYFLPNELYLHDKFIWHLTQNIDRRAVDTNKIDFQMVKSKF